jgi:two-component system sensor histidine kinase/response regulator
MNNAMKFTPEGGAITVRVWQEGEKVMLEVRDTGIGIPADQLARIFDRFYQVDGSLRRRYSGVGLGLALVKELVELHDGRVTVESQLDKGSAFTVVLPVFVEAGGE